MIQSKTLFNPECKFKTLSVAFDFVASRKLASPLLIITTCLSLWPLLIITFYLLGKFSLALLSPQVLHTTTLLLKECIESVFPFIALNLYIYWAIRGMDPLFIRPYRVSINYSPSIKSNDCQGGGWV